MTDFTKITACGECCVGCSKKTSGSCPGCIEADGYALNGLNQAGAKCTPAQGNMAFSFAEYATSFLVEN